MKIHVSLIKSFFAVCFFLMPLAVYAQSDLHYNLETFGSVATGNNTPFWMVNNTYGVVPLKSDNAYLRGAAFFRHQINEKFQYDFGVDLVGAARHSSPFFVQQLYGEISFQSLYLTLGSKEYYNSMLDRELSSGDFDYSTNARPIPEIKLSIPTFVKVPLTKGILQARGDFSVGKSTDNNYTIETKAPGEEYATDVLWHHKSLFFLLEDPEKRFPLAFTFGVEHAVQWGGWTSVENIGEMPHSFEDFIRIVLAEGGGDDSAIGDQINVLGNQQGTFNVRLAYDTKNAEIAIYKQHYFDDKSGVEYANWRDGIWGIECTFHNQTYLEKIVLEYVNTSDQSGPMHFLYYNRPSSRGGGNDDYYNHDYYISGWSHWGRTLGNPLVTSPEYNDSGQLYFKNNRVKALHLGLKGNVNPNLSYRILATGSYAWGRMSYPFLEKKNNFSSLLECNYVPPKYNTWKFGVQLALDNGSLYENNFGCSLKISKAGFINY